MWICCQFRINCLIFKAEVVPGAGGCDAEWERQGAAGEPPEDTIAFRLPAKIKRNYIFFTTDTILFLTCLTIDYQFVMR